MQAQCSLDDLKQFSGSEQFFRHWTNRKLVYTEGINYLAIKMQCFWLIDEIAIVLLPKLLKHYKDSFYTVRFIAHADSTATITVDDGNNNIHITHKINWTDFSIKEKEVKMYLCDSGSHYCLMLPSEY